MTRSASVVLWSASRIAVPRVGDAAQRLADLGDHDRRQPQRRLVEKQQPRLSHQRAADREHLLLTAAQKAGALVDALAQDREHLEDLVAQPPLAGAVARRERAEPEVLTNRQIGEHAAPLERLRDAERHQARRVGALGRTSVEADVTRDDRAAVVGEQPADGAQKRRLAGTVGADERDRFAGADVERDVRQREHRAAVSDRRLSNLEQAHPSPLPSPGSATRRQATTGRRGEPRHRRPKFGPQVVVLR